MTDRTILVVGGGVAAGSTASTLREEGFDGSIVVVTDEPRAPYERPPLSKGLLKGEAEPDDAAMHEQAWWVGHEVELRTGRTVVDLGLSMRRAVLDDGDEIGWDGLVLATGATPHPAPVEGRDLDGVHVLRSMDDALRLRTALAEADRVAIVGGSWIGLEVAAAARAHDCEVVVIAGEDEPLAPILGTEVGAAFRALHEGHGVELRMGARADHVVGEDGRATGVALEGGDTVDADVVVLGTGVRPNIGLAKQAGLALDAESGGVLVDGALRTSVEDVFAIGDVAAHDHPRLGRLRVEHVEVARGHGATAAKALLGQDVVHDELPLFYTDQYDLGMEYVGHATPENVVIRGSLPERPFVAFYLDEDDVVRAGMHADEWDATDVIRELVGRPVDPAVLADTDVALEDLVERATTD